MHSGKKTIWTPWRAALTLCVATLLLGNLFACDSLGGLGGDSEGFNTLEAGVYPDDQKIDKVGVVRLTDYGIGYIESQAPALLASIMGEDGLTFVIPGDTVLDLGFLGEVGYCPDGCPVTIGIDSVNIDPIPTDTVDITIMLSPLSVPIDLDVLVNCDVVADTGGLPMAVTAELTYGIDPYTRQFVFEVNVGDVDTNNIDIHGTGGWNLCGALVGGIANLVKPLLEGTINDLISDQVTSIVDDLKCVGCPQEEGDPECNAEDGYSCNSDRGSNGICQLGNGQCQPTMFGLDAEVDVGALAGGVLPGLESRIWLSLALGGAGNNVSNNGMNLALFGGTTIPEDSPDPCIELDFMDTDPAENLAPTNLNQHDSPPTPFMASIGLAEKLLDQAGYTLNNSGLLCLSIDQSLDGVGDFLSLGTFSLLLSSMNRITNNENVTTLIKLQPGKPLDFEIFKGETAYGTGTEVDTALKILVDDLQIHLFGFINNRFTRLFIIQVDAEVTAGIDNQGNAIQLVLDGEDIVLKDWAVPYSVIGEPPEEVAATLEELVGGLLGQFLTFDPFAPIEIPPFDLNGDDIPDLAINMDGIYPELPKSTAEDSSHKAIGIYASLGTPTTPPPAPESRVSVRESYLPTPEALEAGKLPYLVFDLGRVSGLQYQFQVDNGPWSRWKSGDSYTLKNGFLLWEGKHVVRVRARDIEAKSVLSAPQEFHFDTDFIAPSLKLRVRGESVMFEGSDQVTKSGSLRYSYRLNQGSWSPYGESKQLHVKDLGHLPATLSVRVMDEQGFVTERTRKLTAEMFQAPQTAQTTSGSAESSGCQSTGFGAGSLMLLLGLGFLALSRRVKRSALLPMLMVSLMAFGFIACDDGSSSTGCSVDTDCGVGQVCQNGNCVPYTPSDDDDDLDGDSDPLDDDDDLDGDEQEDGDCTGEDCPCESDEQCGECYYCHGIQKVCTVKQCSTNPECVGVVQDCTVVKDYACAVCDESGAVPLCQSPRCGSDDDCGCLECDNGLPAVCDVGNSDMCQCKEPCGGCAEGDICCQSDSAEAFDTCVPLPGWCEGVQCDPGYQPGACDPTRDEECTYAPWDPMSYWSDSSCTFDGPGFAGHESCECQEKPPIVLDRYGRYNSLAASNADTPVMWISAYNDRFGDLMVGHFTAAEMLSETIHWEFIDGVPEDAEPTQGPSGPRGGVTEPGMDVGKYTALAIDTTGNPRVAYQDAENMDLLFAYTDDDGATWTKMVVDTEGETGFDSQIYLAENDLPVIVYRMARLALEDGSEISALKIAMAQTASPTVAEDWTIITVDQTVIAPAFACGEDGCGDNQVCVWENGQDTCISDSEGSCDPECAFDEICTGSSTCMPKRFRLPGLSVPDGTGINPRIGLFDNGTLWILYYHNDTFEDGYTLGHGNLMRARLDGGAIAYDGLADRTFSIDVFAGTDSSVTGVNGDIGLWSSIDILPSEWYAVSFQNRSLHQLQFFLQTSLGDPVVFTVDDGLRSDNEGNHYFAWVGADNHLVYHPLGEVRIVYQNQSDVTLDYFEGVCDPDGCGVADLNTLHRPLISMQPSQFGQSAGYFVNHILLSEMTSVVSTWYLNLAPEDDDIRPRVFQVDDAE